MPIDHLLERVEKIASICLPLTIALVGGLYTYQKDKSDEKLRVQQTAQDLSQKQYANLTSLLPMLLSKDAASVSAALNVYTEEAKIGQAPIALKGVIEKIGTTQPEHRAEAQIADQSATLQTTGKCKAITSGIFIQVANDKDQLKYGQVLASKLKDLNQLPPIQGVQRVDQLPSQTNLRYYFDPNNNAEADKIIASLKQFGFTAVQRVDLTQNYLKVGCPPPPSFELWLGVQLPLNAEGTVSPSKQIQD